MQHNSSARHPAVARMQRADYAHEPYQSAMSGTATPNLGSPTPSQYGEEKSDDDSDELSEDVEFKELIKR